MEDSNPETTSLEKNNYLDQALTAHLNENGNPTKVPSEIGEVEELGEIKPIYDEAKSESNKSSTKRNSDDLEGEEENSNDDLPEQEVRKKSKKIDYPVIEKKEIKKKGKKTEVIYLRSRSLPTVAREPSRRTVKPKHVFDPSDTSSSYSTPRRNDKRKDVTGDHEKVAKASSPKKSKPETTQSKKRDAGSDEDNIATSKKPKKIKTPVVEVPLTPRRRVPPKKLRDSPSPTPTSRSNRSRIINVCGNSDDESNSSSMSAEKRGKVANGRTSKIKKEDDPSDSESSDSAESTTSDNSIKLCRICKAASKSDSECALSKFKGDRIACAECHVQYAHSGCTPWTPWTCDLCRKCVVCDKPAKDRLVECWICTDAYHTHCGNISKSQDKSEWACPTCVQSFMPIDSLPNPKLTVLPKVSNLKQAESTPLRPLPTAEEYEDEDDDEELDEVPDCSHWGYEQVHSYFQMYVSSQYAEVFLETKIDGKNLLILSREFVLKKLNLKIGPALKVYSVIKRLQSRSWDISLCWG